MNFLKVQVMTPQEIDKFKEVMDTFFRDRGSELEEALVNRDAEAFWKVWSF